MKTSTNKLNQAIERMSSGYKVNHAKDNAANYSISTNMSTKISAYEVAESNTMMGLDMLSTANESLTLIEDKLMRLRALATQANNGTYGAQSLEAINTEANALVDEIGRIYSTSEYNGVNVLGKAESSKFIKDIVRRDTSEMTKMKDVDENIALTSGTYSISTDEDLAKLARMTNNGKIGANTEFVLANNIDLKAWCEKNSGTGGWVPIGNDTNKFRATCDGNGYVISNIKITRKDFYSGLFGGVYNYDGNGAIKNLGVENIVINTGYNSQGGITATLYGNIINCYTMGEFYGAAQVGGLTGTFTRGVIKDCYSEVNITNGNIQCGGLVGNIPSGYGYDNSVVVNSYATGNITARDKVGGLIGVFGKGSIIGCYATGDITATNGTDIGQVAGIIENTITEYSLASVGSIKNSSFVFEENNNQTNLQVGISSNESSQIGFELGFLLGNISELRLIGIRNDDFISQIDSYLAVVNEKQTELGATQNRLESALDEISTQYENLVSGRSTLRDADMAELSSTYVQQQILQQAAATLMSSANQSPAIALQLI